jgi:hypothetical protein
LDEVDHAVDIGDGREEPEVDHGAAVRWRVRGARLVELNVRRIGNDGGAGLRDLVEQAPLVGRAAKVDSVGVRDRCLVRPAVACASSPRRRGDGRGSRWRR